MLAIVLFLIFIGIRSGDQTSSKAPEIENKKSQKKYRYAKPSQRINNFSFDQHKGSKRVLSIRSRNLIVRRGKIGGLKFALVKKAVLNDGIIKFYYETASENNSKHDSKIIPKITPKRNANNDTKIISSNNINNKELTKTFDLIASKESKLLSVLKNVSSIVIHPVTIEFYNNQQLATSIAASSAVIKLSTKKIVFKHNVTVISGKRQLTVDSLEFNPENRLMTGTNYVFISQDETIKGKTITTDLSLQKVYE